MKRSYKKEWAALLGAVIITSLSLYLDFIIPSDNWFARSGAIMVLLAVFVEYRISAHVYEAIQKAQHLATIVNNGVPPKAKPSKQNTKIANAAHVTVVIGTFIWGYGDLLIEKVAV